MQGLAMRLAMGAAEITEAEKARVSTAIPAMPIPAKMTIIPGMNTLRATPAPETLTISRAATIHVITHLELVRYGVVSREIGGEKSVGL